MLIEGEREAWELPGGDERDHRGASFSRWLLAGFPLPEDAEVRQRWDGGRLVSFELQGEPCQRRDRQLRPVQLLI